MSFDDPDSHLEDEFHPGHDLETGFLARVREWPDIFPWSRLGRTLRVAGSPPLLLLTAMTLLVWWIGESILVGRVLAVTKPQQSLDELTSGQFALGIGWAVFIWAPAGLLLSRQGASLAAGRGMIAFGPAISHAFRRTPRAWIAAVAPLACIAAFGIMILVVGWLAKLFHGFVAMESVLAIVAVAIAIPCGVLAFGACFAVPLSWAALAVERHPDPLDSLSRGYESLYRRPLHSVFYVVLSLCVMTVIGALAWGVAMAAAAVATFILDLSGCSSTVPGITQQILLCFPIVVVLTLMWSLIGGIYLLLRYDTGGQEVEDLWQPEVPSSPSLPGIPST